jgi:hypothetical protein
MKTAWNQLSLKEMFAIVTLISALFADVGAQVERRTAMRRAECLPALRQGHSHWRTPEVQRRIIAAQKLRDEDARRHWFRAQVAQAVFGITAVVWLASALVVALNSRRAKSRGEGSHDAR